MKLLGVFYSNRLNKIRLVTMVCFVLLMYISKVSANESQYVWLITNNLVGPAVTLVVLSVYSPRGFFKPFYIIWTILGMLGTIGCHLFWYTHQVGHLYFKWATIPLNIWFLGAVIFKYIEEVCFKKSFKIKIFKWEIAYIVCMLLMVISLSTTVWPFYYLIVFLLLWHTPLSLEQKRDVLLGIVDGILIGFVILQSCAFIYTPFLQVRYIGIYNNCNRNACLYLVALVALLSKKHIYKSIYSVKNTSDGKKANKAILIFDICISLVFSFIFYTGSRTGILGAALIMLIYYFFSEHRFFGQGILRLIRKSFIYLGMMLLIVPLLYFPIRYLPEVRPFVRVVVKNIIRGTDAPFYTVGGVSFKYAVTYPFIRFFESNLKDDSGEGDGDTTTIDDEPEIDLGEIESDPSGKYYTLKYDFMYYPERGVYITVVPKKLYVGLNAIDCRINIAAALIDQMNLIGHDDKEIILRIVSDVPSTPWAYSFNEQNYILHYLYVYGVPTGILALMLMTAEVICLIRRSLAGNSDGTVFLLLISVYYIFGLTEIVWVPGQIEQLLLFFAPLFFDKSDAYAIAK